MGKPDDEIRGDVIAALGASPRVRATDIRVETRSGWTRLTGVVGTLEDRTVAEEIASSVPGVVSIENSLVISSDGTISDLEIEHAVADELVKAGLAGVGVRVQAGTAFLMGVVPSLAVEIRASEVASAVRGIRDVVSELEIAAGEPVDDIKLANDVAEALSDDLRIEAMDLNVQAEDGSVLITGKAADAQQVETATAVSEAVPGVQYVENRMKASKPSR